MCRMRSISHLWFFQRHSSGNVWNVYELSMQMHPLEQSAVAASAIPALRPRFFSSGDLGLSTSKLDDSVSVSMSLVPLTAAESGAQLDGSYIGFGCVHAVGILTGLQVPWDRHIFVLLLREEGGEER